MICTYLLVCRMDGGRKKKDTSKKKDHETWKTLRKEPSKLKKPFQNLLAQGLKLRGSSSKDTVHVVDPLTVDIEDAEEEYIESTFAVVEHQDDEHGQEENDEGQEENDEGQEEDGEGQEEDGEGENDDQGEE